MHVLTPATGEGTYLLAVSKTHGPGGAIPTAVFPSWEGLSARLSDWGVTKNALAEKKTELDSRGWADLQEIELTPDQFLGFVQGS